MTTHPRESAAAVAAPPDDPRVVRALEAYLGELEAGGAPDRAALLAEYADVAGPLADCLDGLDALHAAADPFAPRAGPPGPHAPVPADPDRLGDFRLIREIGRGGMGVVYEAEEVPLGRRVAVKTLPAAAGLTPADLRRFRHEARAAALLNHPHVVPVYSVGTARGVPYLAMRLVRGRSLAELIERSRPGRPSTRSHPGAAAGTAPAGRPAEVPVAPPGEAGPELPDCPRFAARLALQAADALQHAHAAGVVHRDVKPANLLLDEAGHLWVADFGLAYLPGASRLTQPGALVGTLLYMAPEQVDPTRGAVDHRADLYGLGATLYELLTRRPVVNAADHRVAVARILGQAPVRPRRIDPRIPRDLQTVVLTLLAKEPADRYPSAAAAADDLRRFLDGKPVLASRPGPLDQAARWAARHRRPVAAAAATVLAVVGLQAVSLHRLARERDATRAERQQARAVVDDLYTHFAERRLAHEPGLHAAEREFLVKAQAHYDRLAAADGSAREDRLAAAVARRRVADIDARLGDLAAADAAYADAGDRLRRLTADDPGWAEAAREAAVCAADHATLLRVLHRFEDAGGQYAAAAAGFRALLAGGSADPFDQAGLAGAEAGQGLLWQQLGRPAEAEACFRAARGRFARLAAERPDQPAWLGETAGAAHNLAGVLAEAGRDDEAERAYREAAVLRGRAAELAPERPVHRRELLRTRTALAATVTRRGATAEAGRLAAEAVAGWERLAADFPAFPDYAVSLAWGFRTAAEAEAARPAEALRRCDRAAALVRPLADGTPGAAAELARVRHLAGTLTAGPAAAAAFRDALAAADRAGDRTPFDRQTRVIARLALARLVPPAEAEGLLRPVAPGEPPAGAGDRAVWALARCGWAEAVRRAGRADEAAAAFDAVLAAVPAGDEPRAAALSGLARTAADAGRLAEAVAHQTAAVAAADRLHRQADTPARRVGLADELVALAELSRADAAANPLRRAAVLLTGIESPAAQATLARAELAAAAGHADRGERAAAAALARQAAGRLAAGGGAGWAAAARRADESAPAGRPLWAAGAPAAGGGWGSRRPASGQGGR